MTKYSSKKETLKQSVGFSAIGSIGTQIISLLGFIVLARLLSPHEFGLMAMVAIFTSFATIFIEMGMGAALIHNQEATVEYESTAFWFNLGLSILCLILIVICAGFIADFFHEPKLEKILQVVSLLLPLNALAVVPMAMLQKRQMFKHIAMVELGGLFCGVGVALVLAIQGVGVWALVANLLTVAFVKVLLLFVVSNWRPRFLMCRDKLRELWSYSGYLMGTGIANYFITNVDAALVGRLLGSSSLGMYKYAYQLANLPGMLVSSVFSRVFFPAYATYKEDKARIRKIHFKAVRMIAFVTFPLMLILASVSNLFVLGVLGEKWLAMAPILSFMCVIFLIDSIGGMNNPLFLSQGKTKELFWLTVILRSNLIIAMFVGIQFGLEGLLWGLLLAKTINFSPVYILVGRTVGFSLWSFIRNIFPPLMISILVAVTLGEIQRVFIVDFSPLLSLFLLCFFGIALYLCLFLIIRKQSIQEIYSIVFRRTSV